MAQVLKLPASSKLITVVDLLLFFAFTLLTLYIRLRYLNMPLERDEGEYAYAGQQLANGYAPFENAYNMKFPGTYYVFAFLFSLFRDSVLTIRIGFLIVHLLNTYFVFLISKNLMKNTRPAIFSACIYILLNSSFSSAGLLAKAEPLVVLFSLAGIFTILIANQSVKNKNILFLMSGILMGLAVLMKQNGIFFCIAGFAYIVFKNRLWLKHSILYGAGFSIPLILLLLVLLAGHTLDQFYYFAILYASEYSKQVNLHLGIYLFRKEFQKHLEHNLPAFLVSGAALITLFFSLVKTRKHFPLIIFFICSFLAISSGFYFRPHYFLLVYPAISIISGWLLFLIVKLSSKYLSFFPDIALSIMLIFFVVVQTDFIFKDDSKTNLRKMFPWLPFYECKEIGENIKKITGESATIGMIGSEPQIAFYAQRQLSSGFMYIYPMLEDQKYSIEMVNLFLSEIEEKDPEIFIYSTIGANAANKVTGKLIEDWWAVFGKDYTLYENITAYSDDGVKYLRADSVNYQFDHWVSYIKVYRRNDLNN
ncbi:MAG: ArnT family glycosyltransferase [Chitinophagales bacterium]